MLRTISLVLLGLLSACGTTASATPPLLLDHVTVINGRGGAPLPDRAVLVQGGRIVSVGPSGAAPIPADARRIDLRGRFLVPGLIDSHVHLKSRPREAGSVELILANLFLGSGVTTVRDMGGNGAELAPLRIAAEAERANSPRILLSSLFTGPRSTFWMTGDQANYVAGNAAPGSPPWIRHIASGEGIEDAVRQARQWGAAGIKVHSGFTADELAQLGAAARRNRLLLWTHGMVGPARPGDAVRAGAASISHADMLAYEGLTAPPPGFEALSYRERTQVAMRATPVEGPVLGQLFRLMRERGTCLEPTLLVMSPNEPAAQLNDYVAYAAAATARAHREGVAICAGTDVIRGRRASLLDELALLVRHAGLTPMDAIRAATLNNARALGLADRGVIAPGMAADLVVLTRDPTQDIGNLASVEAVILAGAYRPAPAAPGDD
jgi:imidazolonepropionase-like amidohydrolase